MARTSATGRVPAVSRGGSTGRAPASGRSSATGVTGLPELPRVTLDLSMPDTTGYTVKTVRASGGDYTLSQFGQALLDAQPGWILDVEAGQTLTAPDGGFLLGAKTNPNNLWILIRSSAYASLPAPGRRVSPADAANMPLFLSPTNRGAFSTNGAANFWRLIGLEISAASSVTQNTGLVRLGTGLETSTAATPTDITVDRCYIHGAGTHDFSRGVALLGRRMGVTSCYIAAIHFAGSDSQAIAGWNGPGPFHIENNYLEATGEITMFGGADPKDVTLIPQDITIRRNYYSRPLTWHATDPSYGGTQYTIKNIFELKLGVRVLVEDNILEHCWQSSQAGMAFNLKVSNQEGTAPWSNTQDITIRNNWVRGCTMALALLGRDSLSYVMDHWLSIVRFENNLFEDVNGTTWNDDFGSGDGSGNAIIVAAGGIGEDRMADHLQLVHNTFLNVAGNSVSSCLLDNSTGVTLPMEALTFQDNILNEGTYGFKGNGLAVGKPTLDALAASYTFDHNLIVGGGGVPYPSGNAFPAAWSDVGFTSFNGGAGGDYHLSGASAYRGTASDGTDPGCDIDTLMAAVAGVLTG